MKRVAPAALQPDMEIAEDVHDRSGRLLLRAGQIIGTRQIQILKMWGIPLVTVLGENESLSAANAQEIVLDLSDPAYHAAYALIAPRFVHADLQHPAVAAVLAHCLKRVILRQRGSA